MTSFFSLSGLQRALSGRQDILVLMFLIVAVGAMILPITPDIADVLIAINISVSVVLLMTAFYIRSATEFSVLPSLILISTVFRMSISIASTRLILIEADGGQIIQSFGDFVISGNVVVGLVIFLIITVVQFIVITKGSERVAEVAARFSLDGLPGKQMSIDSDLRSGDIDQAEARRRRHMLEKETQLYGAMDGAMKFVKGDAIAGIIIIAVNLIGGAAIGTMQRGLSLSESTHIFSLLTIGEGLISQIPALLISLTAGTIVTRVTSGGSSENLGSDVFDQVTSRSEALQGAGFVLVGLAAVPGFPTFIFLTLGVVIGGSGFVKRRNERRRVLLTSSPFPQLKGTEVPTLLPAPPSARVHVAISNSLSSLFDSDNLEKGFRVIAHNITHNMGVPTPNIALRVDNSVSDGTYAIEIDLAPEVERNIAPDQLYVSRSTAKKLTALDIEYFVSPAKHGKQILSVSENKRNILADNSIQFLSPSQLLEADLSQVLSRNASHFLGIQETKRLLTSVESDYRDLLREVQRVAPVHRIAEVLRRLLDEGISIRNIRMILEAILEWAPREQDNGSLAAQVRTALRRQLCFQYADPDRVLKILLIERPTEDFLRSAAQNAAAQNQQLLDPTVISRFLEGLRQKTATLDDVELESAVLLTAADIRRLVWSLLEQTDLTFPVLCPQDIIPQVSLKALATIQHAAPRLTSSSPRHVEQEVYNVSSAVQA